MFQNVKKAFQIKEIRNRLIFTVIMLFVIRFGSQLPVPGVDRTYFSRWLAQQTSGDAFSLFDAFTGGSFLNMSILALNITPYITASIILQLLTIAIPKLEEMQREGEEGRKLIVSITRYVTVALSVIEAAAMAIGFGRNGLLQDYNALNVITVIVVLTAGSAVVMWLGERITEKGVGNGISIVLTINIVSRIPSDIVTLFQQFVVGKKIATEVVNSVIIVGIIIGMTVLVILLTTQSAISRFSTQEKFREEDRSAARLPQFRSRSTPAVSCRSSLLLRSWSFRSSSRHLSDIKEAAGGPRF